MLVLVFVLLLVLMLHEDGHVIDFEVALVLQLLPVGEHEVLELVPALVLGFTLVEGLRVPHEPDLLGVAQLHYRVVVLHEQDGP